MKSVKLTAKKILLYPIRCYRFMPKFREELSVKRSRGSRVVFMLGTPVYGNIGDQAITYAQHAMLRDLGLDQGVVEVNFKQYFAAKGAIAKYIQPEDIIVLNGGGNLGSLWPFEDNKARDIIRRFPNNRVVIFPQSCYYSDSKSARKRLQRNSTIYREAKDLTIALRDKRSFNFCKENFDSSINFILVPDIVLYLSNLLPSFDRSGLLMCLRDDKECVLSEGDRRNLMDYIVSSKLNYTTTDTVVDHPIYVEQRESELFSKLEQFSQSSLVITDRLHAMIFAIVTGTPCLAFDNLTRKVSGVAELIDLPRNVKICRDIDEVKANIEEYYYMEGEEYHPDKDKFYELLKLLKK